MTRPKRLQSCDRGCTKSGFLNMFYPNGSHYVGEFKNNLRDGNGKFTNKKGYIYEGEWLDGHFEGWGTIKKRGNDGCVVSVYQGQFKNWKKHGEGKQFFVNGFYEGLWRDGKRAGLGIMWYNDGSVYLGNWKDDKYDEIGTMVYDNGNWYEGMWRNGLRHGEGTFYHNNHSQVQKGIWLNDGCTTSIIQDISESQSRVPKLYLENPQTYIVSASRSILNKENKNSALLLNEGQQIDN